MKYKALLPLILLITFSLNLQASNKEKELTEKIDSICALVQDNWNLPGMAVVVIKDGRKIFVKGYGKTSIDKESKEITPDTRFVIASTSKAMTAALMATLADKELVNWNDTVINHLGDFKLYDPWVTKNFLIKDIMVHKTGFNAYATDDLPHFGYNRDEIYTLLGHLKPTYSFRTKYAYNNAMFTVAAKIIEKHYRMSWDDAIKEFLFKPLKMNSSTTGNKSYFNNSNLARGHRHYIQNDTIKTELRTDTIRAFKWLSAVAPAGFVITTANDMGNWLKMNLSNGMFDGDTVISEKNHSFLFYPQTITGNDSTTLTNYAQGWTIEHGVHGKFIRHTGLAYGYTALVGMVPQSGLGIAVLTNQGNTTTPHMAIAREIIEEVTKENNKDWIEHYLSQFTESNDNQTSAEKPDSIAPSKFNLYTGEYYKQDFGTAKVNLRNDSLIFSLKSIEAPLIHKNENTFTIRVPGAGSIDVIFYPGINVPFEALTFDIGDPLGKFYKNPL